jgi:hypothetical protein
VAQSQRVLTEHVIDHVLRPLARVISTR